jgi:hypothetical protein
MIQSYKSMVKESVNISATKRNISNHNSSHFKRLVENFSFKYKYIFFPEKNDLLNVNRLLDITLLLGFIFQFSVLNIILFVLFLGYLILLLLIEWKNLLSYNETDCSIKYEYLKIFKKLLFFIMVVSTFTNVFNLFYVIEIDENILPKTHRFIAYVICQNLSFAIIFLFVMLKSNSFFIMQKEICNEFSNKINIYMRNKLLLYNMKLQINDEYTGNDNRNNGNSNNERKIIEESVDNNPNNEKNLVMNEVSMPVMGDENEDR